MPTERLTVSLAPDLRHWINDAIESGGYSSASDFVATLIRNHKRGEQLDHLLTEGLASGTGITPDEHYWANKKTALLKKASL